MLGHSSIAITLSVYSHTTATMHQDAADRLGAMLSGAVKGWWTKGTDMQNAQTSIEYIGP
jgi:hypothetical protein